MILMNKDVHRRIRFQIRKENAVYQAMTQTSITISISSRGSVGLKQSSPWTLHFGLLLLFVSGFDQFSPVFDVTINKNFKIQVRQSMDSQLNR